MTIYNNWKHWRKKGIADVVIVVAVLLAALPFGLEYFHKSPGTEITDEIACANNRTQLRRMYTLEHSDVNNISFEDFLKEKDCQTYAACPSGGLYTLFQDDKGRYFVICSIHTHEEKTPEDKEAMQERDLKKIE